jgi:transposase-like protein
VWAGWKDVTVAKPYPKGFRDDVVRVARNRDDGVTIEQIAADFGVHPITLSKWMRQADIDEGSNPGLWVSPEIVEASFMLRPAGWQRFSRTRPEPATPQSCAVV